MANVTININGADFTADVEPRLLLTHFIRENANLTGTHTGCDTSGCGACTVWLDGVPVKSCTMFAVQAHGKKITTIEGLVQNGALNPMQEAFKEMHGLQCGFCTPGMILTSVAFLKKNPNPTEDEVRWAISGNLCRCTGYNNIVAAVQYAAGKLRDAEVTMAGAHSAEGGN